MTRGASAFAFFARYRVSVASWSALTVIAGMLAFYSVNSLVHPVHRAELNDGGVWVTSQTFGLLARENKPVGQADAFVNAGQRANDQIDVLQNQSAVVLQDGDTLTPVNVVAGTPADGQGATVKNGTSVFMGGTAIGAVDPATGSAWVGQVDPTNGNNSLGGVDQAAKPVISKLGGGAAGVASVNGTVFVASGETGKLATLTGSSTGNTFPTQQALSTQPKGAVAEMSAVGEHPLVLDVQGNLIMPGGVHTSTGTQNVRLQQPGPDAGTLVYADGSGLHSVSLADGTKTTLVPSGSIASGATPSQPVVVSLGSGQICAFGVWSDGSIESNCGPPNLRYLRIAAKDMPTDPDFQFRVNRNAIVLNEVKSGALWSVSPGAVTPLQSLEQQNQDKQSPNTKDTSTDQKSKPPTIPPINLGARNNGSTTVLHVLDDASAAPNAILAITGAKPATDNSYSVQIGPDRQTLLVTVKPNASGTKHLSFTVDDGLGNGKQSQGEGTVNLAIKSSTAGSSAPTPRHGYSSSTDKWSVSQSGSVDIPVTANYRDKVYGDPIVLKSVSVSGPGYAQALPNGAIHYVAPSDGGSADAVLSYVVNSGGSDAPAQAMPIHVVGSHDSAVAPIPEDDAVAGVVGAPITLHPLANDRPGADGQSPYAAPQLVSPGGHSGLDVTMDQRAGTITVSGTRSCIGCLLSYTVAQGNAPQKKGTVRVDLMPQASASNVPVTAPVNVVVRGSAPAVVDVLANDYDPQGGVLVVQDAAPARTLVPSRLNVSVVSGRWIRVSSPVVMIPSTQTVTYDVSNGHASAEGTLTVTQLPATTDSNVPVVEPMSAVVRAGYAVNIPVLDNASTPSGDPVALAPTSDGTLPVVGDSAESGTAYIVGNSVRYVPPATVKGPTKVQVLAPVVNADDTTASPVSLPISVTVNPPGPAGDSPPSALPIIGRVVQGGVVTLKLPSFGADRDGDPVSITSLTTSPKLGRILAVNANSITYQALPTSAGTDTFGYAITDPYGLTDGSGTVEVAIAPPGVPQAPVAQNITVQAAPGRALSIDVLSHVLHPATSKVWLQSVGPGANFSDPSGALQMRGPAANSNPVVIPFTVTNGVAQSTGNLTVIGVSGFDNAPQIDDIAAQPSPGDKTVTVKDILSKAYDIDDGGSDLKLGRVGVGGTGSGDSITAAVMSKPQAITFEVVDAHGGSTSATLYVPAAVGSTPYLKPGAHLDVSPRGSVTKNLSDLVASPNGKQLYLTTTATFGWAPHDELTLSASGRQGIKVSAPAAYHGPGFVSFQVSDSSSSNGNVAMITVPVQVGARAPVITCPDGAIPLYQGGDAIQVDVAAVCNVWTPRTSDASGLKYSVTWGSQVSGVSKADAVGGFSLTASAGASLATGSVIVKSGNSNAATVHFDVRQLPPPVVTLQALTCIKAKPCAPQDLSKAGVFSYLPKDKQHIVITDVSPTDGVTWSGPVLKFHPTHYIPPTVYSVTVNDAGGRNPSAHSSTGQIVLAGIAPPDAPQNVTAQSSIFNEYVDLKWNPSKSNGNSVDQYEVDYRGPHAGKQLCGKGTSCQVHLPNSAQPYFFTVKAHNVAGWGTPSTNRASGTANIHPGDVLHLHTVKEMEGQVQIAWDPPAASKASGTVRYEVKWAGNDKLGVTSPFNVTGLTDGTPVAVTVIAYVTAGGKNLPSPGSPWSVTAAGKPVPPPAPTFKMTSQAGSDQAAIVVSWGPTPDAKGKAPIAYQVTRTGGPAGIVVVCPWLSALTCSDTNPLTTDGTWYSYTVEARNGAALDKTEVASDHTSAPSPAGRVQAENTPDPDNVTSATPIDQGATVNFHVGNSHGSTNDVYCTVNGNPCSGTWPNNFPRAGGDGIAHLTGLSNGTSYTVAFHSCNGSTNGSNVTTTSTACGPAGNTQSVTPYGPIQGLSITASGGSNSTAWNASVNANGASVHIVVARSGGGASWSYDTSGPWSGSAGDGVGYSWTGSYTITVTDTSGHGRATQQATSNTVSTQPPPPPPQTVTAYAGPSGGATGQAGCSDPTCSYIGATLSGFSGTVTCSVKSATWPGGTGGFITWKASNGSQLGPDYAGRRGQGYTVVVSCGGVDSPPLSW